MHSKRAVVLSILILSGCTATQLKYQTLDQSQTVESITEKQIYFNLERFDKNPYAFPSQVTVVAGSASTTDSVSPTFMTPLGEATMVTSQLANAAMSSTATAVANMTSTSLAAAKASGTSSTTTNTVMAASVGGPVTGASSTTANGTTGGLTTTTTNGTTGGTTTTGTTGTTGTTTDSTQSTRPNRSLSLSLGDSWMESWTLDPVTNPDVLRRLSALYRYVLGQSELLSEAQHPESPAQRKAWKTSVDANQFAIDQQFICDYPVNPATSTGETAPTISIKHSKKEENGDSLEVTTTAPDAHARVGGSITVTLSCLIDSQNHVAPRAIKVKPSAMKLPDCVVCLADAYDRVAPDGANVTQTPSGEHASDGPPLYVNPNLRFGFITRGQLASNGVGKNIDLGRAFYGDVDIDPKPHRAFHEFELFVDAATIVSTAGTSAGTSDTNQKLLAVPISPNGFLLK